MCCNFIDFTGIVKVYYYFSQIVSSLEESLSFH